MTAESGRIGRDKHLIVPCVHLMSRENSNFYKIVVSGYYITSYVVAGCPANRKSLSHNTLRKNPTKCIHALASYCLVGLEAGLRKGQTPKPAFSQLTGRLCLGTSFDRRIHLVLHRTDFCNFEACVVCSAALSEEPLFPSTSVCEWKSGVYYITRMAALL